MTAEREYRARLLAMLTTYIRPRLDKPFLTYKPSLHVCSDPVTVRATSKQAALRILDDTNALTYTASRSGGVYGAADLSAQPKTGDVIMLDGSPEWQYYDDGHLWIRPYLRPLVARLIHPRSWNEILCPLDHAIGRGRRLPEPVTIELDSFDHAWIGWALGARKDRPSQDPTRRLITQQVNHSLQRSGASANARLRLSHDHLNDITQALLEMASFADWRAERAAAIGDRYLPSRWRLNADMIRVALRHVQNQAVAQTIEPPTPRPPPISTCRGDPPRAP